MATYFGTKPKSDWKANGPASSGHDFINQINEQKGNVTNKTNEYQNFAKDAKELENTYKDTFNNQASYNDLYDQAAQQARVNEREEQYQRDLDAVNATRRTMYTLPSTVNSNSEARLNSAQRAAALSNQTAKYQNIYNDNVNMADTSSQAYQTALGVAQANAGQALNQQQANIAASMQAWQTGMQQASDAYNQLLQERNILRSIYGDMYDDEYKHRMQEIEIWADNLSAETARYQEAQANYRAKLAADAQKYAANIQKYLGDMTNKATNQNQASFVDYVLSNENLKRYGSDMGYGDRMLDATRLANNYQNALRNGEAGTLNNITNGQVYRDYLDWLNK